MLTFVSIKEVNKKSLQLMGVEKKTNLLVFVFIDALIQMGTGEQY